MALLGPLPVLLKMPTLPLSVREFKDQMTNANQIAQRHKKTSTVLWKNYNRDQSGDDEHTTMTEKKHIRKKGTLAKFLARTSTPARVRADHLAGSFALVTTATSVPLHLLIPLRNLPHCPELA